MMIAVLHCLAPVLPARPYAGTGRPTQTTRRTRRRHRITLLYVKREIDADELLHERTPLSL